MADSHESSVDRTAGSPCIYDIAAFDTCQWVRLYHIICERHGPWCEEEKRNCRSLSEEVRVLNASDTWPVNMRSGRLIIIDS